MLSYTLSGHTEAILFEHICNQEKTKIRVYSQLHFNPGESWRGENGSCRQQQRLNSQSPLWQLNWCSQICWRCGLRIPSGEGSWAMSANQEKTFRSPCSSIQVMYIVCSFWRSLNTTIPHGDPIRWHRLDLLSDATQGWCAAPGLIWWL